MKPYLTLALLICLAALSSTTPAQNSTSKLSETQINPFSASLKFVYDFNKRNIIASAEKMPEADYSFKPTPDVRSFAELLGHIADVNYLTCSMVKGEPNPNQQSIEKTKSKKAEAIQALKASFDYCDGLFGNLTDAALAQMIKQGNSEQPKSGMAVLSVYHGGEHYGNITTYLRLKGIVPPSTERAQQQQAQPAAPTQSKKDESGMPHFDLEEYQFGMLKRGPKWTPETTPETERIQAAHMAHIGKMAEMGKLVAAGPMGDNGDLRGIFLFRATRDEAQALAADDPAVKSGRLAVELLSWMGPKGIGAVFSKEYQKNPKTPLTMTTYYLALFKRGPKWTDKATPELQKLQLEHLWQIRRLMDAKTFAAAGPFTSASEWLGLLVIAAGSLEEARAIAESDPTIKAGHMSIEVRPWYVAKEVWP